MQLAFSPISNIQYHFCETESRTSVQSTDVLILAYLVPLFFIYFNFVLLLKYKYFQILQLIYIGTCRYVYHDNVSVCVSIKIYEYQWLHPVKQVSLLLTDFFFPYFQLFSWAVWCLDISLFTYSHQSFLGVVHIEYHSPWFYLKWCH